MRELRAMAAVGLAAGGWLSMAWAGSRFEFGNWAWLAVVMFLLFGPAGAGLVASLPRMRGTDIAVPGIAAAVVPPAFALLFLIPRSSPDGTTFLVTAPFFGVIVLGAAMVAWGTAKFVESLQLTE